MTESDVTLGAGMLPPLKVTWKPVLTVAPVPTLAFQAAFLKVQVAELQATLAPFHTYNQELRVKCVEAWLNPLLSVNSIGICNIYKATMLVK